MLNICHRSYATVIRQHCNLFYSTRYLLTQSRLPLQQCLHLMSSAPCGYHDRCGNGGINSKHVVSRFLFPSSLHGIVRIQAYASKGRGRKSATFGEDNEETLSDDEEDEEKEEDSHLSDDEVEDDETAGQKTWKDMSIHATSLRIDAILSGGLGISRKKIEDGFLDARLMLNQKVISKKSKTVKVGDVVDMVLKGKHDQKEDIIPSTAVMRVKVLRIGEEVTSKERIPVKLRRWKYLKV